jgi:hypothetical protein
VPAIPFVLCLRGRTFVRDLLLADAIVPSRGGIRRVCAGSRLPHASSVVRTVLCWIYSVAYCLHTTHCRSCLGRAYYEYAIATSGAVEH